MPFKSSHVHDALVKLEALTKSQAVIEFDPDGHILMANDNFLNAMGYRLEEVKGRHHSMFVCPEYAQSPEYMMFWNKLHNGHFEVQEYRRFGKDGREIWIQASYNPVRNKGGRCKKLSRLLPISQIRSENRRIILGKLKPSVNRRLLLNLIWRAILLTPIPIF